jgi:thioredoxin reductase
MQSEAHYDVVVIGGGPAGLAGGLWLARYQRRTLIVDAEEPRNAVTTAIHGYLGLQDIPPDVLRSIGRAQAVDAGAEYRTGCVERVEGELDGFRVVLTDGSAVLCRRLLICTGLLDIKPEIPGFDDFHGTSIWHCPDCDGPTARGRRIAVIGWGRKIAAFCTYLLTWTDQVVLLTHGHPPELPARARQTLERFGIPVREDEIERLEGTGAELERVIFHAGPPEEVGGLFYHIASGPGSSIPVNLGCECDEDGIVSVDHNHETSVPGVYAAGDITPGSRLAIRAAAEGMRAAIGIHKSLMPEERRV